MGIGWGQSKKIINFPIFIHLKIFSLLSCGLFVSDGLISAFFRADDSHGNEPEKAEAILIPIILLALFPNIFT